MAKYLNCLSLSHKISKNNEPNPAKASMIINFVGSIGANITAAEHHKNDILKILFSKSLSNLKNINIFINKALMKTYILNTKLPLEVSILSFFLRKP